MHACVRNCEGEYWCAIACLDAWLALTAWRVSTHLRCESDVFAVSARPIATPPSSPRSLSIKLGYHRRIDRSAHSNAKGLRTLFLWRV